MHCFYTIWTDVLLLWTASTAVNKHSNSKQFGVKLIEHRCPGYASLVLAFQSWRIYINSWYFFGGSCAQESGEEIAKNRQRAKNRIRQNRKLKEKQEEREAAVELKSVKRGTKGDADELVRNMISIVF